MGQGQGRGRRRVDRHLHGPRQRLAEPVHLRPALHDQGRLRAQRDGRGGRLQQQVLRRAVRRDARPRARARSCCSTTCATRRATPSRATPSRASRSPASAPTTTPPGSSRPARRPSSPTATPAPSATCGRCSRPTSRSRTCGARCRTPTATSSRSPSMRTPGATVFQDPEHPDLGLLPLAGDRHASASRPTRSSPPATATPAPNPTDLVVPGNAAVTDRGRRPVQRPGHAGRTGGDRFPPGRGSASSTSPARRPPRARRWSRSRASTTRRSPGSCSPPTSRRATARRRSSARSSRAVRSRRTATGRSTRPPSAGRFTETVAWTLRVRNAARRRSCSRRPAPAPRSRPSGTGWSMAHPVPDGTYTVSVSGVDGWDNAPASATRTVVVDTDGPGARGPDPRRRHDPVVLPERRRLPRHGLRQRDERRDRHAHRPRPRRRRRRLVKKLDASTNGSAAEALTWNGRTTAGGYAPDGTYTIRVVPRDLAGNTGDGRRSHGRRWSPPCARSPRAGPSSSRRTTTRWPSRRRCRSRSPDR